MAWGGLVLDTAALNLWSDINFINDDNDDVNDDNDKCDSDDDYNLIDNLADDHNGIHNNEDHTFYVFPLYS